eukprot:1139334-Pelagomonas_calceolata.AAC.6
MTSTTVIRPDCYADQAGIPKPCRWHKPSSCYQSRNTSGRGRANYTAAAAGVYGHGATIRSG